MAGSRSPLTCGEVLVIVVLLGILLICLLPMLARTHEEARRANCKENCTQIGKAMLTYCQDNGGFLPFAWGPTTGEGRSRGGLDTALAKPQGNTACDASSSLGCLYPQYLVTAKAFRCPSMNDAPVFTPSLAPGLGAYGMANRTWALGYSAPTWPSYGYDPRVLPEAAICGAILADMDGSYVKTMWSDKQNHDSGQNVLYMDGHVAWATTNCASNDPNDNIFAEAYKPANPTQGWHADTDSFMVRGSIALTSSYTYAEFQSLW